MDDDSIRKAIESLERTLRLLGEVESKIVEGEDFYSAIWHAAEEAEYAALLLSLKGQLLNHDPDLRSVSCEQLTIDEVLSKAEVMISEAIGSIGSDLKYAYDNVRATIFILRSLEHNRLLKNR
ncbi:MAG: hypothetical protein ACUVTM_00360 [Candidatus Bathyarchaeia archaeon]